MSESNAFPARPDAAGPLVASSEPAVRRTKPSQKCLPASVQVWSWFRVVLAVLVILKLLLISGQGESLYETHWRIAGIRMTWINDFAWYVFLVTGTLGLMCLGRCSQFLGASSARVVNAILVVLGLSFIFLTFHNGDKNYFYPPLSGVLSWASLGPYIGNSLFFNSPFLAGWLFAYAAGYYVLARTGRENKSIFLTAAFGFAYALINLRGLKVYRNELLIIDCVGCLSLFMALRFAGLKNVAAVRLSTWRPLWLVVWSFFFGWALMRFDPLWQTIPATYFVGLIAFIFSVFALATLFVRNAGNPSIWSWMLPFFLVAFLLLTNSNYPGSGNYNHLLCLALTFPRYIVGELALVASIALAALIYRKLRPDASLWWLDSAGFLLIVIAGADLRLAQIMGVRLGWDVLSFGDSPKMMFRMAKPYLAGATLSLLLLAAMYALALRVIRIWSLRTLEQSAAPQHKRTSTPKTDSAGLDFLNISCKKSGSLFLSSLIISLGLVGLFIAESDKAEDQSALRLVRTSPLWKRVANRTLSREEFLNSARALGLGDFETGPYTGGSGHEARDLNVVLVFLESSYNKHLSLFGSTEETQPLLSKYKDRMELFPNFFSAFTGSIHARFATFTSLYPVLDFHAFTQERVPVKSIFEVFHDRGYTCSMFYSSFFDYTGFRDFLKNRGLDEMYDADTMPGQRATERVAWGLLEEETLGAMRNQLKKYAQAQQRFCLTYVPAAPHYPYDKIPKRFQKYKMKEVSDFTPLYLNELLYIDWVLASIVDELKDTGLLEHTLVVITNDHGEMLGGKEGHIGHGWSVTPQLANTPLILMDPERPGLRVNKTIGTQVDLLPTILDRLNIPIPQNELYEGQSLDTREARVGRLGYLNSFKEFGILCGDQVLLGDRESNMPSGVASSGAVYTITNEGTRTSFFKDSDEDTPADGNTSSAGDEVSKQSGSSLGGDRKPNKDSLVAKKPLDSRVPAQLAGLQERTKTMARFDAFQENLLRNYSSYQKSVRSHGNAQLTQVSK
jgi:phosphoglycerol transferase MdoB-like AlkP superfamily enzyme